MLLGGNSALVSGGALTAGSGMVVNVAQAVVISANGILCTMPAGTVTPAAGGSQPRIDVVYALVTQGAAGTPDTVTGRATFVDTATVGLQPGMPAGSPAKPAVPSGFYVQIGSILVPAGASTSAGCTLSSGDTVPNSQGPIGAAVLNAAIHAATSMAAAVVHGFRATAAGGTGNNMLAQTDAYGNVGSARNLGTGTGLTYYPPTNPGGTGNSAVAITDGFGNVGSAKNIGTGTGLTYYPPTTPGGTGADAVAITDANGNVGGANAVWDGTTRRGLAGPGVGIPNAIPTMDANGRVADSNHLQGLVTGSGSGQIPVLDSNGAVAKAEGLVAGGVTHKFTAGKTAPFSTVNQADVAWTVTLDDASFTPTVAAPSVYAVGATATHQVMATVTSISAGSVSGVVYQVGGPNITIQVGVFAYI